MRDIGFSTGAVAYGDFHCALKLLAPHDLPCIELSALRMSEVETLVSAIPALHLSRYRYISFHAPSDFSSSEEADLANLLYSGIPESWPIVLHPDAISEFGVWRRFGRRMAIENMDRRKPVGRNREELKAIFDQLPEASLCFDAGHARQCDSSMTDAFLILSAFRDRLVQIHLSEVNSQSQHDPISYGSMLAFRQVSSLIPEGVPIILESRVNPSQISKEVKNADLALRIVEVAEPSYA